MKLYDHITKRIEKFIAAQKIFFVATAADHGRINLSPKGMDSFRVIDKNKVLWLNLTGSGNETAAHLNVNGRITIMFCSFEGAPMILRLYGKGSVINPNDDNWADAVANFPVLAGTRQIIDIDIETVQTSCGMSIPYFDFKEERLELDNWAKQKGKEGLKDYWKEKNEVSIDGIPTKIQEGY
ncbi:pyridoxamine 5'-phosphate oxidase family protein [Lutimonas sp.]|jgi:hypothetical protein|uniref:pyridoxamine 5'-phosphate oxidase family protein n=1 Tax=Lutimonas sp. TaxID=1872403 RepID=UPI003C70B33A